jgi:hypothetical protein
VPKVPVSGPRAPKGAKKGPPPNPGPVLAAVNGDLSQLTAINDYSIARADVSTSRLGVARATAGVRSALATQAAARAAEHKAEGQLSLADYRLQDLAISAYMGLGYATPAAGPLGLGPSGDGTVTTPGGLTGTALVDAQEMLRIVAGRERKAVTFSHQQLTQSQRVAAQTGQAVAAAQTFLAGAQAGLAGSQQTLALVVRAATNPQSAAALHLAALPRRSGPARPETGGSPAPTGPSKPSSPGASSTAAAVSALDSVPTTTATTATTTTTTTIPPSGHGKVAAAPATTTSSPSVLGPSMLNASQLAAWFTSTGHKANTTVPITQLAADYVKAGQATGVRADIAFAQSVVETGFFSFPSYGQLTRKDNNFAGIGACDTCAHGWSFKNALTGVEAQMELLDAYASIKPVPTPLIGNVGIGGCCPTWIDLAGTWASSLSYGISIMTIYHQMLSWLIPQQLVSAGIIAPEKPPATTGPTAAKEPTTTTQPSRAVQAAKASSSQAATHP